MAVLLTVVIGTVSVNAATDSGTFGENGDNLTWEYDDQTKTLTISGTGEMEDWPAGYATPWGSYQMEITTVVINDGVTNIGKEAFSNYHALTSVTLPNSVTDIRFHGFQGSENLASIDLPDNLTTIGGAAFYGCHALTDVTIPDSVTTMEDSVFANCYNLTNVVIGKNEALRRINEGASMIRTKGEPGTGDVVQAVRHIRKMNSEIARLSSLREDELFEAAKALQVPYELVQYVHKNKKLPVVNFAAGGVATPADAALMMQLGAEGVFVGSGIFKSGNPEKRAQSIVKAVTNFNDAKLIAELSEDLGEAMVGINENEIKLIMEARGQ